MIIPQMRGRQTLFAFECERSLPHNKFETRAKLFYVKMKYFLFDTTILSSEVLCFSWNPNNVSSERHYTATGREVQVP